MPPSATLLLPDDTCQVDDCESVQNAFFSRDREFIALCTTTGISLFSSHDFSCKSRIPVPSGVHLADVAPYSSLLCVVTGPSSFQLFNGLRCEAVSPEVTLEEDILNVKLMSKRVLVLTAGRLLIFRLSTLELIEAVERGDGIASVSLSLLECNEEGLCAFTIADNGVQVVNSVTLHRLQPIRSHTSPVSALELGNGILVTGSNRGTILRVFRVPSMELVGLLRRGRNETPIRSITGSLGDPEFITVAGDSDTIHLFRQPCSGPSDTGPTLVSSVLSIFPKQYKDALEAQRDFAFVRLRREGAAFNYTAAVIGRQRSSDVVVVSQDTGFAFVYELNGSKGGECRLKSEHALLSGVGAFKPRPQTRPIVPSTVEFETVPIEEVKVLAERSDESPGETATPADFCIKTDEDTATPIAEPVAVMEASRGSSMDAEEWTEETSKKKKKKKKKKSAEPDSE